MTKDLIFSFRAIYDFYIEIAGGIWYNSFPAIQHFIFFLIFLIWLIKPSRFFTKTFSYYFSLTFLGVCGAMTQMPGTVGYSFAAVFFFLFLIFLYNAIKEKSVTGRFSLKHSWAILFLIVGLWYPVYTKNIFLSPYGLLPQPTLLVVLSVMVLTGNKINPSWRISAVSVAVVSFFTGIFGFFYLKIFYDIFLIILSVVFFFLNNLRSLPAEPHSGVEVTEKSL